MTRTHPNQSLDTLMSLIIEHNTWQFAAFPYIWEVRKVPKHDNKNLSSKSAFLIPTVSTSAFHSTNLFLFSRHHIPINSSASFSAYKPTHNPPFLQSLWRRDNVHMNELVNRTLSWLIFQIKAIASFGIEIFQEYVF